MHGHNYADRFEAVGSRTYGYVIVALLLQCLVQDALSFNVQGACCFIQECQAGLVQQQPGKSYPLLLTKAAPKLQAFLQSAVKCLPALLHMVALHALYAVWKLRQIAERSLKTVLLGIRSDLPEQV